MDHRVNNTSTANPGVKKLAVIGGGAAGFFCAVNAARENPALEVTIYEKSRKILSKVRISGGGRCNVTHHCFDIGELIRYYPRGKNFLKKSFHWFGPSDTIAWFESRGVRLKTESDGRMFPVSNNSETIIDCLVNEAAKYGVAIRTGIDVRAITRGNALFYLETADNTIIPADYVCVAVGGYPKASQFDWIKNLGHSIEEPVPSLFTFNVPEPRLTALMGISVANASVKILSTKLSSAGPLLITHWGLSGPLILRLSAWNARELASLQYHFSIQINWIPLFHEQSLREKIVGLRKELGAQTLGHKNPFDLPQRLWSYILERAAIDPSGRWTDLTTARTNTLVRTLVADEYRVTGKTTFKEEFVTCGGVSLGGIDANTMQSKSVKGLFFAGEIMDVDGITGGFNFQNAWTSGWIAARTIAELR